MSDEFPLDPPEGVSNGDHRYGLYFTSRDIDNNSPSRKDGISLEEENNLRMMFVSFLRDIVQELKTDYRVNSTAELLCHRFFYHRSHLRHDKHGIAIACLLIASEAFGIRLSLDDDNVIRESLKEKLMLSPDEDLSVYLQVLTKEVREVVGDGLDVELPFMHLLRTLNDVQAPELEAELAIIIICATFWTTLSLEFSALTLARAAVYLAYFLTHSTFDTGLRGFISVDEEDLERIVDQLLLYFNRCIE